MKSCFECDSPDTITNHHVVPRILGGKRTVPLCSSCHGKVHDRKRISHSTLTKIGLAKLKKAGRRISRTPYGFDLALDGKNLIKNKNEQKVVNTILIWRKAGFSLPKIASKLDKQGNHPKRSKKWNQSSVNGIIKRWGSKELLQQTVGKNRPQRQVVKLR